MNLNTGQVITTALGGPPTAEARAEALSRVGLPGGVSVFGGPLYRLSVRTPYQASPVAWLRGHGIDRFLPDFDSPDGQGYGRLDFLPPPDWVPGPADTRGLAFFFSQVRLGAAPPTVLLSIPLYGNSYPGAQGHVSLSYFHESGPMGPTSGQVRVGVPQREGVVWLDILYTLETQSAPVFSMDIETGVAAVSFSSATITSPPPVIHP